MKDKTPGKNYVKASRAAASAASEYEEALRELTRRGGKTELTDADFEKATVDLVPLYYRRAVQLEVADRFRRIQAAAQTEARAARIAEGQRLRGGGLMPAVAELTVRRIIRQLRSGADPLDIAKELERLADAGVEVPATGPAATSLSVEDRATLAAHGIGTTFLGVTNEAEALRRFEARARIAAAQRK